MGKSTSDTFRDLLGGITDDLKEAFDDIIDYDEHGRRRDGRRRERDDRWWQREDYGRRYGRDHEHWRQREDDGRWNDRDREHSRGRGGARRSVEDDGYQFRDRASDATAAADFPRQSRREEAEQDDLRETVQALRSELSSFVEALRETSAARGSVSGQESRRT
jgi:hypothetical protein